MWPHGVTVEASDSNPFFSLVAKVITQFRDTPINLLGYWYALCWLLQPVAAVYTLRGFRCRSWEAAGAASILVVLFPALLTRLGHTNLCGHFVILAALGLTARMIAASRTLTWADWLAPCGLMTAAVLFHPYLFIFAAGIFAAPALKSLLDHDPSRWRTARDFLLATVAPVVFVTILSGPVGGADRDFGFASMNLISPIWPQHSGLFGPDLPIVDATGLQYEGFNYLGAGNLLLVLCSALLLIRYRDFAWRVWRALVFVLLALTFLALSTRVFVGHVLVINLGTKPWDQVFGIVRSSGRAFWPVGYSLVLGSIAYLPARLPSSVCRIVLASAVVLQLFDTSTFRADARTTFTGGSGQNPPPFDLPAGTTLLTTVPGCTPPGTVVSKVSTALRLIAARREMRMSFAHVGRSPSWFNCETPLSDGMDLPLRESEVRVFLETRTVTFRAAALGAGTVCGQRDDMIVCTNGVAAFDFPPAPAGPDLPSVGLQSGPITGSRLVPLLSFGWHLDQQDIAWSEGPRATLLFRTQLPNDAAAILHLRIEGIARDQGSERPVVIRIGDAPIAEITLPDRAIYDVSLTLPAGTVVDGVIRIALDINRPVDPARRGLQAPVHRAGVRIHGLDIRLSGPQ